MTPKLRSAAQDPTSLVRQEGLKGDGADVEASDRSRKEKEGGSLHFWAMSGCVLYGKPTESHEYYWSTCNLLSECM